MLISVIVPVHNVERYIDKCILSLVSQTHSDLEIILIDDGSTDKSSLICDEWAQKDKRIKTIHTENRGVSHARNIGLDIANGELIGFIDADDWIDNDMYEILLNGILQKDVDICVGEKTFEVENHQMVNPKRGKIEFQYGSSQVFSREAALEEAFSIFTYSKLFEATIVDKLFRKKLFFDVRFDENISQCEDILFFCQLMKNAKTVLYLPLHKYHYLMRESSAIHQKVNKRLLDRFDAFLKIKQILSGESEELKKSIEVPYTINLVNNMRIMLLLDEKKYERQIRRGQAHIRNHIMDCFSMRIYPFSFRSKFLIGALFFCFPFPICRLLQSWIRLKND